MNQAFAYFPHCDCAGLAIIICDSHGEFSLDFEAHRCNGLHKVCQRYWYRDFIFGSADEDLFGLLQEISFSRAIYGRLIYELYSSSLQCLLSLVASQEISVAMEIALYAWEFTDPMA